MKPELGDVVSNGTLNICDTLPAFARALHRYGGQDVRDRADWLSEKLRDAEPWTNSAMHLLAEAEGLLEDADDALNELAPEGVYFGANEGDGACFGFWECDTRELDDSPKHGM